uniref:Uncharacterized protein n=1 Tax=Vespula pensylvanica TaxID=30213 RepID=A0A834U9I0_VESPE|nr:hypothetical protein H0235_008874 [Vespula pensylvanica]
MVKKRRGEEEMEDMGWWIGWDGEGEEKDRGFKGREELGKRERDRDRDRDKEREKEKEQELVDGEVVAN